VKRGERDGGEEGWHAEKEGIPFLYSLMLIIKKGVQNVCTNNL
jgi:hypothetical protein